MHTDVFPFCFHRFTTQYKQSFWKEVQMEGMNFAHVVRFCDVAQMWNMVAHVLDM